MILSKFDLMEQKCKCLRRVGGYLETITHIEFLQPHSIRYVKRRVWDTPFSEEFLRHWAIKTTRMHGTFIMRTTLNGVAGESSYLNRVVITREEFDEYFEPTEEVSRPLLAQQYRRQAIGYRDAQTRLWYYYPLFLALYPENISAPMLRLGAVEPELTFHIPGFTGKLQTSAHCKELLIYMTDTKSEIRGCRALPPLIHATLKDAFDLLFKDLLEHSLEVLKQRYPEVWPMERIELNQVLLRLPYETRHEFYQRLREVRNESSQN